jgi:hypothetical protein
MEKTANLNKKQREDKENEDKITIKTTECLEKFSKEGLQVVDDIGEVLYKNEDVLEGNKIRSKSLSTVNKCCKTCLWESFVICFCNVQIFWN